MQNGVIVAAHDSEGWAAVMTCPFVYSPDWAALPMVFADLATSSALESGLFADVCLLTIVQGRWYAVEYRYH